jgi:hypothetical protein
MRLEGLGKLKKIHLIGTRSRDLPAYSIMPQPRMINIDESEWVWKETIMV